MCRDRQLCELIRTCSSPAHPVLQPQRKPGHLPDQPTGHPLHTACTQVRLWRGCIHTLNTPSVAESVKCLIPSLSLSDLTITPLRASMTGLSWPPTPGMRTLVENGRWRSRTWLEPTTMVIAHPSNLQGFFCPPYASDVLSHSAYAGDAGSNPTYMNLRCTLIPFQVSFTNIVLTLFKYLLLY